MKASMIVTRIYMQMTMLLAQVRPRYALSSVSNQPLVEPTHLAFFVGTTHGFHQERLEFVS